MAGIEVKANQTFTQPAAKKLFDVGQKVWVNGVEFAVFAVKDGQLILQPVTAKV